MLESGCQSAQTTQRNTIMNKHPYKIFYPDFSGSISVDEIIKALNPNMISAEESKRLGMKTVVTLYTKFSEQVKNNPGLTSYFIGYACSGRMIPSLEKDFELIVSAFGWKVTEWGYHGCILSVK